MGKNSLLKLKYEELPFSRIYYYKNNIFKKESLKESTKSIISSKIETASKRVLMMLMAKKNPREYESYARFNISQYLDPLFGIHEIEVLYHIEAMILFARSILDIYLCFCFSLKGY